MIRQRLLHWVIAIAALLLAAAQASAAQPYENIERELACTKMSALTDESEGPMGVDGYMQEFNGHSTQKYVFWCQRSEANFLLVFTEGGKLSRDNCGPFIEWLWYPRGLRLVNRRESLSDYVYLEDFMSWTKARSEGATHLPPVRRGPIGKKTQGHIIQDGTSFENYFYCYDGHWLMRQRD